MTDIRTAEDRHFRAVAQARKARELAKQLDLERRAAADQLRAARNREHPTKPAPVPDEVMQARARLFWEHMVSEFGFQSKADLARELRLTRASVSNTLNGKQAPGPKFLEAVRRSYGSSVAQIIEPDFR